MQANLYIHAHARIYLNQTENPTETETSSVSIYHKINCVKTNIGKMFIKTEDKYFPKSSKLHKIFNRNILIKAASKNMLQIIKNAKAKSAVHRSTHHTYL